MSNRLKEQGSPYLLQHAENPVDWYPWGEEAFQKAEREDKPVFLSIGYSTCHWCHVMAHESFENQEIAELLNRWFISVKVDREERPDIDSVYMSVCQALTGSGGWPMSIFMTARQEPFFAGTYFPSKTHYGRAGFADLLYAIADKWKNGRAELLESAKQILAHISRTEDCSFGGINQKLCGQAAEIFDKIFDETYGGFGDAPKFPTPHNLIFLTLYSRLSGDGRVFDQVKHTLEQMRRGGIFDHIGYGFSRYSTDRYFLVPHFEKMLYDNALLILAYSAAYKASGDGKFLTAAEQTAEYVLREMTGDDGEFYSAQDADSEGEEGKFYVFGYEEICKVLGEEKGRQFCSYFGITEQGNFEGKNIPNLLNGNEISNVFDRERKILYDYRKARARLQLDDKILTSWNSLMICAFSMLYRVTGNGGYLQAAKRAQQFIEANLRKGNILFVSCRDNVRAGKGFLDEYACYTAALVFLYESSGELVYLKLAKQVCREAQRQFADEKGGGYFLYGTENDELITRPKESYDGAIPSGNSVMAYCLVRLSQLTEEYALKKENCGNVAEGEGGKMQTAEDFKNAVRSQLAFLSAQAEPYPSGHTMFLTALLFYFQPPQKIVAVLEKEDDRDNVIARLPLYADVRILSGPMEGYPLLNNRTTYYVCKGNACLPPSNRVPV